jgi:hypothetical protein
MHSTDKKGQRIMPLGRRPVSHSRTASPAPFCDHQQPSVQHSWCASSYDGIGAQLKKSSVALRGLQVLVIRSIDAERFDVRHAT